ncbi:hypothetical protein [Pelagicoccus albus]|uniref:Uncharacterized protein n=1 Tax=Pelagicoccus albus TaxID=415222 RepID=A0A7X1B764_9BACT|nr:hypothetical protein [Pelagicoccus albus]MBC2606669.1 hypothetical protein [Pelagicoccus albus]
MKLRFEEGRILATYRVVPGVEVYDQFEALIDRDGSGDISEEEERGYAQSLLDDSLLTLDGVGLSFKFVESQIWGRDVLVEGGGAIVVKASCDVTSESGLHVFEFVCSHQSEISGYLTNAMLPKDPNVFIRSQKRSHDQSRIRVSYEIVK